MSLTRSPLAPLAFPDLPEIAGVVRRVSRAQYKKWDRCDLTYVELTPGTAVAGVTTKSGVAAESVHTGPRQLRSPPQGEAGGGRPPRRGSPCLTQ